MGNPKHLSGIGIAYASSASDEPAAPIIYPVCDSAQNTHAPKLYKRQVAFLADTDHVAPIGFDHSFSLSGVQPDPKTAGILLWLALGTDAWGTFHTLTPAAAQQYLNTFIDQQMDIESGAGTDPVERLVGGKIGTLTLEQPHEDLLKIETSGICCDEGTPLASISPSVPTGSNNEPIGWKHFIDAGGAFQIDLNGGGLADFDGVKSLKAGIARNPIPSGQNRGSAQPTKIDNGIRDVTFEFNAELEGNDAEDIIAAFKAAQTIGIRAKWMVGINYLDITIPLGTFSATPIGDVGQGEESIMLNVAGVAYKGTDPIITVLVKDGTSGLYSAL